MLFSKDLTVIISRLVDLRFFSLLFISQYGLHFSFFHSIFLQNNKGFYLKKRKCLGTPFLPQAASHNGPGKMADSQHEPPPSAVAVSAARRPCQWSLLTLTTTWRHRQWSSLWGAKKWRLSEVKGLVKSDATEGTSPVVHWLRISLAVQGTRVQTLVRELKSHMPQSPSATTWESVHLNKRSHNLRDCEPQQEITQLERLCTSTRDHTTWESVHLNKRSHSLRVCASQQEITQLGSLRLNKRSHNLGVCAPQQEIMQLGSLWTSTRDHATWETVHLNKRSRNLRVCEPQQKITHDAVKIPWAATKTLSNPSKF